jgi:hypothetical protein
VLQMQTAARSLALAQGIAYAEKRETTRVATMSDLVQRLRALEFAERDVATSCDHRAEDTANWEYANTAAEAADEIERLRKALLDFGTHGERCPEGSDIGDGMCNCGFSAALVKATT